MRIIPFWYIFVPLFRTNVDKKMKASFNESEKNLLRGQAAKLAAKHLCSQKYVKLIINGDRDVKSKLSRKVLTDLLALIELLSPQSSKDSK